MRQSFCLVDGLKLGNNNDGKKLKKVRSSNISVSVAITNDLLSECHFNNVSHYLQLEMKELAENGVPITEEEMSTGGVPWHVNQSKSGKSILVLSIKIQ